MMLESLIYAGASMAIVAAAWVGLWRHRRRVDADPAAPGVTYPDRIAASAWRLTPDEWAALPEGKRVSLRKNIASAPGPRRG